MKNISKIEATTAHRPLMKISSRKKNEARIMREMPHPKGLVLGWCAKEHLFIAMIPKCEGTWENGRISVVIAPHEAVKIELFIEACTLPIIKALQASAEKEDGR